MYEKFNPVPAVRLVASSAITRLIVFETDHTEAVRYLSYLGQYGRGAGNQYSLHVDGRYDFDTAVEVVKSWRPDHYLGGHLAREEWEEALARWVEQNSGRGAYLSYSDELAALKHRIRELEDELSIAQYDLEIANDRLDIIGRLVGMPTSEHEQGEILSHIYRAHIVYVNMREVFDVVVRMEGGGDE